MSWKVVRVNSNGSCRHSSGGTFKEEALPLCADFFLTSLPSNSKSGSFHVLRLNNRCMINQTWMHMSAFFFFFFFVSLYFKYAHSPIPSFISRSSNQRISFELNITASRIKKTFIFLILSVAPLEPAPVVTGVSKIFSESAAKLDIQDSISQSICGVLRQFPVPVKFPCLTYKI